MQLWQQSRSPVGRTPTGLPACPHPPVLPWRDGVPGQPWVLGWSLAGPSPAAGGGEEVTSLVWNTLGSSWV